MKSSIKFVILFDSIGQYIGLYAYKWYRDAIRNPGILKYVLSVICFDDASIPHKVKVLIFKNLMIQYVSKSILTVGGEVLHHQKNTNILSIVIGVNPENIFDSNNVYSLLIEAYYFISSNFHQYFRRLRQLIILMFLDM